MFNYTELLRRRQDLFISRFDNLNQSLTLLQTLQLSNRKHFLLLIDKVSFIQWLNFRWIKIIERRLYLVLIVVRIVEIIRVDHGIIL